MKRYKHSLSHTKLFSCDMGELVPCGLTEVLPGDSIQLATNALVRASPLLSPVMHPVNVRLHHWFVPFRLIWEDWEDFITGGPDGMDDSVFPTQTAPASTGYAVGSLADYLGVPPLVPDIEHSMLPFRAYAMIYNEWYRDQDLQTKVALSVASGDDNTTSVALQNCAWEKDYFTSSRPWEQKGPSITVPLGTTAPVKGIGIRAGEAAQSQAFAYWETDATAGINPYISWDQSQEIGIRAESANVPSASNTPQIYADLAQASAVTVNVLREALALQRYQEARARYGSRYTEYL